MSSDATITPRVAKTVPNGTSPDTVQSFCYGGLRPSSPTLLNALVVVVFVSFIQLTSFTIYIPKKYAIFF